jgi:hypothetical protein
LTSTSRAPADRAILFVSNQEARPDRQHTIGLGQQLATGKRGQRERVAVVECAPAVGAHDDRSFETLGHTPQDVAAPAGDQSSANVDDRPLSAGEQLRCLMYQLRVRSERLIVVDRFEQRHVGFRLEYVRRDFESDRLRATATQLANRLVDQCRYLRRRCRQTRPFRQRAEDP